jgi:hypothetical protein
MNKTTKPPVSHIETTQPKEFALRGLLLSIVLNALIPYLLYTFSKKYFSSSEIVALCIAAIFPILDSLFGIIRHRRVDLIAVLSLLGIGVSIGALFFGGNPKIILIRESFFTGAFGVAYFVSLLLPRPLMFYFGRQMMTKGDPEKIAEFDARWKYPYARFVNRLITIVWGCAFVGEFVLRVILVNTLSTAAVLLISPFLIGAITVGTILWTFAYARYAQKRGKEMRKQV